MEIPLVLSDSKLNDASWRSKVSVHIYNRTIYTTTQFNEVRNTKNVYTCDVYI